MPRYDDSLSYVDGVDEESMSIDSIIELIASGGQKEITRKLSRKLNWKRIKKMFHDSLHGRPPHWLKYTFIISCCVSVSLDPLFLFIPIVNQDIKCLAVDQKLKKIALVLRAFPDLFYVLVIILCIGEIIEDWKSYWPEDASSKSKLIKLSKSIWRSRILIYTFSALPIPQIIILVFFPRMRGSSSFNTMKFLNSLLLLQYVPRVYPIFAYCKRENQIRLDQNLPGKKINILVPAAVINFFLYILASHVLGAFWYFFSIQREIDCWGDACLSKNGCELSTFDCDHDRTFKNVSLILNNLCPIKSPNATVFDFGIFLDALQSGIVEATDFTEKFLQCFSWGVRNLSSFASNLKSSTYAGETLFVIFVSLSGLLLFIYLLGHLQTFMQATNRSFRIWAKMKAIDPEIVLMSSEYGLPNREPEIKSIVRKRLENGGEDLAVENIFSVLPLLLKRHLKRHLFLASLKKVSAVLQYMDKKVLNAICERLEPVNYAGGSYIIREGEPLDVMFFITRGILLTYKTNNNIGGGISSSSSIKRLAKGDFYGEELITWAAASTSCFSDLPISTRSVKSHQKVEVFAIMASDFQLIVSEFSTYFNTELPHPRDYTLVDITEGDS